MIAVVATHVVAISARRSLAIDRDRRYCPFSTGLWLVSATDTVAGLDFRDSFLVFFAYKQIDRPN